MAHLPPPSTPEAPPGRGGVFGRRWAWLVLLVVTAGVAGLFAFGPSDATTGESDRSSAPASSQSARVAALQAQQPSGALTPVIAVYSRADGTELTDRDRAAVLARRDALASVAAAGVAEAAFPDPRVATVTIPVPGDLPDDDRDSLVDTIRATASDAIEPPLRAQVTGGPAFATDLSNVFDGADTTLLLTTAGVVAVLLLVTYRSPLLWLVPLAVVGIGDRSATVIVGWVAPYAGVDIDGSAAGILSVLVFGAGTNYALLLVSRYRDELRRSQDRYAAMERAWRGTAPAVLASGTTVALSLLTLLAADLTVNRGLGFAGAVGIVVAMFFGLVVLPAALVLPGRVLFWPFVPHVGDTVTAERRGFWYRLGRRVARRPAATVLACLAVLLALAAGLGSVTTGLPQNDSFRETPESVSGQKTLQSVLPAGAADPLTVVAAPDKAAAAASAAAGVSGVASVGAPIATPAFAEFRVVLSSAPGTAASDRTIESLRDRLAAVPDANALVGGTTAESYDVARAVDRDTRVVVPLVLVIVLGVLVLLLRALIAPVLLIATVVASYFAALGAGWIVFRTAYDFPALDTTVPLLSFLFLVALGVDYNIFLIARTREDTLAGHGTRSAVLRALASTGGVITSAGILLAAVFTVLGVLPLITLTQIGVVVCIGVLLDTLLVRTVLVPALVLLTGEGFWWPGHPDRSAAPGHSK
ncbi:MMPL family transporter [Yinghuangia sp. YIM S10712]|uniref:MMPL family transporter n=1 Tax=Yinghuangia sp. YIM S10712 TaxID=3436930 RepID=UPI003F53CF1D